MFWSQAGNYCFRISKKAHVGKKKKKRQRENSCLYQETKIFNFVRDGLKLRDMQSKFNSTSIYHRPMSSALFTHLLGANCVTPWARP